MPIVAWVAGGDKTVLQFTTHVGGGDIWPKNDDWLAIITRCSSKPKKDRRIASKG